ncbi:MAG: hypothetical protein ABI635_08750 [Actinomycetota bacterium]
MDAQEQARLVAPEDEIAVLDEDRAFADRSADRKLRVEGADAETWLHDLLTADVAGIPPGLGRRSLLLSPTGRIRADVVVMRLAAGFVLVQDVLQPTDIGDLLAPYVLSAAVTLTDATDDLALYVVPEKVAGTLPWPMSRPSVVGEGSDLLVPAADAGRLAQMLRDAGLVEVGGDALEVRRIRRGVARFPTDLTERSVPAEAALEDLIDTTKGCFLGQESVAKIRNLGHPAALVLAAQAEVEVRPGAEVLADGVRTGLLSSAALAADGGTACLMRVGWAARDARFSTAAGTSLRSPRRSM